MTDSQKCHNQYLLQTFQNQILILYGRGHFCFFIQAVLYPFISSVTTPFVCSHVNHLLIWTPSETFSPQDNEGSKRRFFTAYNCHFISIRSSFFLRTFLFQVELKQGEMRQKLLVSDQFSIWGQVDINGWMWICIQVRYEQGWQNLILVVGTLGLIQ